MISLTSLNRDQGPALLYHYQNAGYKHAPGWRSCYCQFYMMPPKEYTSSNRDTREAALLAQVADGRMQGYLALDDGTIVGWCLANRLSAFLRIPRMHAVVDDPDQTAFIGCFVINHAYRNQGLATRLLQHALEDLRAQGFVQVLANPNAGSAKPERMFAGVPSMFEKAGFVSMAHKSYRNLVSLKLTY